MAEPLTPDLDRLDYLTTSALKKYENYRDEAMAIEVLRQACDPATVRWLLDAARAAAPALDVVRAAGRHEGLEEARTAFEWALRQVAAGNLTNTDLLKALAVVDVLDEWTEEARRG